MPNLKSSKEIQALRRLSQGSAASLLGISSRTLRDCKNVPRNADGTYDGPALVAWHAKRLPAVALDDDSLERLTCIAEMIEPPYGQSTVDFLLDLKARFGDGLLLTLGRSIFEIWRSIDVGPDPSCVAPTRSVSERVADFRATLEREDSQREARAAQKFCCVCEQCDRVRRGGACWVRGEPPAGYVVRYGLCPTCLADQDARAGG